jgi:hypothetical protein
MDSKVQPKLMFFDMNSVFGLILDQIADAGRIKNQNNVTEAKVCFLEFKFLFLLLHCWFLEITIALREDWWTVRA